MISENDVVPSDNDTLWRYMNLEKFIALLQTQKLYFTRADVLAQSDPYEGAITENEQRQFKLEDALAQIIVPLLGGPNVPQGFMEDSVREIFKKIYYESFINCWHINDNESLAMWKLFANDTSGIAIKTTFGKLKKALEEAKEQISVGKVKYCNFYNYNLGIQDAQENIIKDNKCLLRKNEYYRYENELRLICHEECQSKMVSDGGVSILRIQEPDKVGLSIPIDLGILIDTIYIAPNSQEWVINVIKDLTMTYFEKNNIKAPAVEKSLIFNNIIPEKQYDLSSFGFKKIKDTIASMVEHSSANRKVKYQISYDPKTGEIVGKYPLNGDYNSIPEPYITVDYDTWRKITDHNNQYIVDTKRGKIVLKKE